MNNDRAESRAEDSTRATNTGIEAKSRRDELGELIERAREHVFVLAGLFAVADGELAAENSTAASFRRECFNERVAFASRELDVLYARLVGT